jgi:ferritin
MIKKTIADAINEQIAKEMFSANLYLSMSAYFQSVNLAGFANWMRIQVQEETFHSMKFFDYLMARGGSPKIAALAAPEFKWKSPLEAFQAAYKHEQSITASINKLTDLAIKESDHATNILLQWFITEQVEEEETVNEIVEKIKLIGDFTAGIIMLDNELKTRVFTPPATKA